MRALRDVLLVAWFDLRESLRSRKAIALIVLYLLGAMASAGGFVSLLAELEATAASALQVSATSRPGAMTSSLMQSEQLIEVLSGLIGDEALARELLSIPPLALFYGWLAMSLVPVLVTFTSAEAVAEELASGGCRYSLFRTERAWWATGKLLGQAALMAVGLLVGAAGVWGVGWYSLNSFEAGPNALWLLRFSGRAWLYGFAFLGMTLGLSQVTRSVNGARALALLGLVLLAAGGGLLVVPEIRELAPVVADSLRQLFPNAHKLALWRPVLLDRLPSIVMLLALGGTWFSAGQVWMQRRDA